MSNKGAPYMSGILTEQASQIKVLGPGYYAKSPHDKVVAEVPLGALDVI